LNEGLAQTMFDTRSESGAGFERGLEISNHLLPQPPGLARKKRTLPHQLVRSMAEKMAAPETIILGRMGVDPTRPS
jgi:hypothetical protein